LHKCKRCGKEEWLSKEYPYVKFELNNIWKIIIYQLLLYLYKIIGVGEIVGMAKS
jgi:hypothetical protein